jgi:uncharacterized protein
LNRLIVVVTNVLVGGMAFQDGKADRAVQAARRAGTLLFSPEPASELAEVVRRPKFDRYMPEATRDEFMGVILEEAVVMEPAERLAACRDPKDDKFLELAVGGRADCIVTGDGDLLALHPFRGIPILTPQQFLEWVDSR